MKKLLLVAALFLGLQISAQIIPTTADKVEEGLAFKGQMQEASLLKNVRFTNIGPTVMSGRVVDVDVNPNNPVEFYVAYASGGLWYTQNNGVSFVPVLDNTQTQNVGDIAVHWKTGTVWVGTGENNASRSSYAGIGLLKSTDNGKNWQHMGLHDSHHIGRILINPSNPDEVVVGVAGHLYSPNSERGIYKTVDGGKSWRKTLFIDDQTGIIDVAHAPNNFKLLIASAWEKDRKAWNFSGNGEGSGLYKSTDGGDSWTRISTNQNGFPTGSGVGRIGLDFFNENIVYAVLDNQYRRDKDSKKDKDHKELQKEDFKTMSQKEFLKLDNNKLNAFLKNNGFQEKYRAENVKQMVSSGVVKPEDLANYLE
ncbi:MAG: glycosyl hydrolase, partial [Eudoraea sp.]|nr:glycosyl hydrolase [Eudoraea sp.]